MESEEDLCAEKLEVKLIKKGADGHSVGITLEFIYNLVHIQKGCFKAVFAKIHSNIEPST